MGSFNNLTKRLCIAVPIIAVLAILVLFSHLLFIKLLILVVLLFSVNAALYEFSCLCDSKGSFKQPHFLWGLASLFVCVHFFYNLFYGQVAYLPLIVAFLFLSFLFAFSFIKGGVIFLGNSLLGLIYIVLPLTFLVDVLLFFPNIEHKVWFIYILVVSKASDIGGYFFGKLFGRHAIAKVLSPRKTVEGTVFGLLFSIGASVCVKYFVDKANLSAFSSQSYTVLIVLGFIIGVLSLLGDLSESLIKRDASIKHSSPFSNFGGALDLMDSLVFSIPFVFFYLEYIV